MEKRSWKFTFRDVLIVLILIAVAILFVQKLSVARSLDRPEANFEIVLRVEVKEDYLLDHVKVGDKVYQKGSSAVFGVVSSVVNEPARADGIDMVNGQYTIDEPVPNNHNLLVTIESKGFPSLNGTPIIDNNMITLNQYLVINTSRVFLPTRVMSIVNKG